MRKNLFVLVTVVLAAACGDAPTAPVVSSAAPATAHYGSGYKSTLPGSRRTGDALAGKFVPANCVPRQASHGSALIGPSGGVLWVGTHRLIVPAGALTQKVLISGTIPEGRPFEIDLQPHGLQFRKPAGLILDARSCVDVPTILYLIDQYSVSPPIPAVYSNFWKMIACPIWHFSGYVIMLGDQAGDDAIGAQ